MISISIDIFFNSSHKYSQKSHDFLAHRYRQSRPYSVSNILLTRSNNNSNIIRDIGQGSRGNYQKKNDFLVNLIYQFKVLSIRKYGLISKGRLLFIFADFSSID